MKNILGLVAFLVLSGCAFKVPQALIEAEEQKCESGNAKSCTIVGQGFVMGTSGFDKNYEKARYYLEKVCNKDENITMDKDFFTACSNLGSICYEGYGVEKDYKKALELFTISCDDGNAASCNNIGVIYGKGQGVKENKAKGVEYYKKSCDAGEWISYVGCGNIGEYYRDNGDKFKAAQYYKKACDLGKMNIEFFEVLSPEFKNNWDNFCKMYEKLK